MIKKLPDAEFTSYIPEAKKQATRGLNQVSPLFQVATYSRSYNPKAKKQASHALNQVFPLSNLLEFITFSLLSEERPCLIAQNRDYDLN